MDNMLYRSAQTGPPNVRKRRPVFPPAGRSSHCTRQVACRTSFLSRQADVIASFLFGACTACTEFLSWKYFFIFYEFVIVLCFGTFNIYFYKYYRPLCLLLASVEGVGGYMMAGFYLLSVCAHCRDKKKGSDPCIETPPATCSHCDALTAEQKAQLSTPSYKLKKEKKEAKSSTPAKASDTLSPTLVDPALVSVVGVVDGQTTSGLSGPAEKKKED